MIDATHILYIHGSSGDKSQTYKARILRGIFPGMLIPDFDGDLPERMEQLEAILGTETGWRLVGSSLGGLMAASLRRSIRIRCRNWSCLPRR
jgi:predicted esterase YcpF (UPF0227 family)